MWQAAVSCGIYPQKLSGVSLLTPCDELLRSRNFRTNLQHCSDFGRQALLETQHNMATIRATARSLTAEEGNIGYIIELLEDPYDAKHNLKAEIDAVTASTEKCYHATKEIVAKFRYWHLVITHLKQLSLTKQGMKALGYETCLWVVHTFLIRAIGEVIKHRDEAKKVQREAEESVMKWKHEKKCELENRDLVDKIEEGRMRLSDRRFQLKLEQAEENLSRAKLELQRLGDEILDLVRNILLHFRKVLS